MEDLQSYHLWIHLSNNLFTTGLEPINFDWWSTNYCNTVTSVMFDMYYCKYIVNVDCTLEVKDTIYSTYHGIIAR